MAQHAHDIVAEQALLGAALNSHEQSLAAFLSVPYQAYYLPKHQALAAVIRDMVQSRQPVDQVTVLSAVQEAGALMRIGGAGYLHTMIALPYMAVHAQMYAQRIVELYGRRRLWEDLTREVQKLDADWESGECGRSIADSVGSLRASCDELMAYSVSAHVEPPTTLQDFLLQEDQRDWLVPGLLERGDRLLLTGAEGFGKSELVSQIALSVAGSLHPFLGEPIPGSEPRVLIVDCENQAGQTRRRLRRIAGAVDSARAMHQAEQVQWGKHIRVEFRTSGLDLLSPADEAYLEALVGSCSPDLLVVGPLYKLHTTDINSGEAARRMLDVLDRLRERHSLAIVTEAHASKSQGANGQRSMEPEGSALFMRWPEFGFGLRRNKDNPNDQADVISWRGQREERGWPATLIRRHSGLLPWGPDPDYYERDEGDWGLRNYD